MRRRDLIVAAGAAALLPHAVRARFAVAQTPRLPLIAWFGAVASENMIPALETAFLEGLREHGWSAGANIEIARRNANGRVERLSAIAAELVRLGPTVMVAAGPRSALAAKAATQIIPIVCHDLGDSDRFGLVSNDARPEANVTGLRMLVKGMLSKQVEVARDAWPRLARLGVLYNPKAAGEQDQSDEIKTVAESMGLAVSTAKAVAPDALPAALAGLAGARVQAVIVLDDPMFLSERRQIATLAQSAGMATIDAYEEQVAAGGLISYGPNTTENWRRAADFVDKILRGAKPSDLPVEFPNTLRLVVNLRTAKALGLAIPPAFLARADQVIE